MAAQLGVVYSSRAIGGAFVIQDARPAALPLSRVLTWVPARQSLTDVLLAVRNAGGVPVHAADGCAFGHAELIHHIGNQVWPLTVVHPQQNVLANVAYPKNGIGD